MLSNDEISKLARDDKFSWPRVVTPLCRQLDVSAFSGIEAVLPPEAAKDLAYALRGMADALEHRKTLIRHSLMIGWGAGLLVGYLIGRFL